jgi:hypothetical protein
MLVVGVRKHGTLFEQALQTSGVIGAEASQVVVAKLVDRKIDDQLRFAHRSGSVQKRCREKKRSDEPHYSRTTAPVPWI